MPATPHRLWLDFINSSERPGQSDALGSFEAYVSWLERMDLVGAERGPLLRRRAQLQPAGATAALLEARRVRAALALLADHSAHDTRGPQVGLAELNRILGRSAGMRQIDVDAHGRFRWSFEPAGDAFAGLILPIVELASESLVRGELAQIRRCAAPNCQTVFLDTSRNGSRRWCAMRQCGNRAKQRALRVRRT